MGTWRITIPIIMTSKEIKNRLRSINVSSEYEHYSQLIYENSRFLFYIHSSGLYYKVSKKTNKHYLIKGFMKEGFRTFKINGTQARAKNLVASVFMKDWKPNMIVEVIDGDQDNICVTNLKLSTYRKHGCLTGHRSRSRKVVVIDKDNNKTVYRSGRQAAKALYVSYQTLFDYLNNKVRHRSIIDEVANEVYLKESG